MLHRNYLFGVVGTWTGIGKPAGVSVSALLTEAGILSALASNWLTCHSWVSVNRPLKPGIPVMRIPFCAFQ